jgi:hypothetical protein
MAVAPSRPAVARSVAAPRRPVDLAPAAASPVVAAAWPSTVGAPSTREVVAGAEAVPTRAVRPANLVGGQANSAVLAGMPVRVPERLQPARRVRRGGWPDCACRAARSNPDRDRTPGSSPTWPSARVAERSVCRTAAAEVAPRPSVRPRLDCYRRRGPPRPAVLSAHPPGRSLRRRLAILRRQVLRRQVLLRQVLLRQVLLRQVLLRGLPRLTPPLRPALPRVPARKPPQGARARDRVRAEACAHGVPPSVRAAEQPWPRSRRRRAPAVAPRREARTPARVGVRRRRWSFQRELAPRREAMPPVRRLPATAIRLSAQPFRTRHDFRWTRPPVNRTPRSARRRVQARGVPRRAAGLAVVAPVAVRGTPWAPAAGSRAGRGGAQSAVGVAARERRAAVSPEERFATTREPARGRWTARLAGLRPAIRLGGSRRPAVRCACEPTASKAADPPRESRLPATSWERV